MHVWMQFCDVIGGETRFRASSIVAGFVIWFDNFNLCVNVASGEDFRNLCMNDSATLFRLL